MREMNQLVNTEDSAWPIIQNWLKDATNHTELLPVNKDLAETALYQLQVTTKSPMGALVYGSGGLLIDNGWLRIAGSGHPRLPRDPVSWTQRPEFAGVRALPIADDASAWPPTAPATWCRGAGSAPARARHPPGPRWPAPCLRRTWCGTRRAPRAGHARWPWWTAAARWRSCQI